MIKFSLGKCLKGALLVAAVFPFLSTANEQSTKKLLPEEFQVYYNKNMGISTTAFKGGQAKTIPTSNTYEGAPGCYIACHGKNQHDGVYPVSDNTYMMGQIRVQGHYANGYCIPKGYESKDIRQAKEFKEKCALEFPEQCKDSSCSISGQTAGWF